MEEPLECSRRQSSDEQGEQPPRTVSRCSDSRLVVAMHGRNQACSEIIEKIIDLSSFDKEEDTVAGMAPEYITRDQVSPSSLFSTLSTNFHQWFYLFMECV